MNKNHSDKWVLYLFRGFFAFTFGVMALILPSSSFTSLVIFLGVFMIADGGLSILFSKGKGSRTMQRIILLGVLVVVVGALAFYSPFMAIVALLTLFALWSFFSGLSEMLKATNYKGRMGSSWYFVSILLTILIGLFVVINPTAGNLTLAKIFGFYSILTGILFIFVAIRLKYRPPHRTRKFYPNELSHY